MRKLWIFMVSLLFLCGTARGQNRFGFADLELEAGEKRLLSIEMTNGAPVIGFQFDLQLPAGVRIARERNEDVVRLSDRAKPSHTLSSRYVSDGSYRIVASSLNNSSFRGESGTVVEVMLEADEELALGSYFLGLKNGLLIFDDKQQVKPAPLSQLVNVIEGAISNAFRFPALTLKPGEEQLLAISLKSSSEVVGFQCDLVLPAGIEVVRETDEYGDVAEAIKLTERRVDHQLTFRQQAVGTYRIVALSTANTPFSGTRGDLLTVRLRAIETVKGGMYRIRLNTPVLSLRNQTKLELTPFSETITVQKFRVNTLVNNAAFGTARGEGSFNYGEPVTLQATPNPGLLFSAWKKGTEVVSKEASHTFPVTGDGEYMAYFIREAYQVSVTEPVNGTVTGAGNYEFGSEVELVATPATGYAFVNWTRNGKIVSTEATYRFTAAEKVELTANFKKEVYAVTVTEPVNGKVEGGGNYEFGAEVKLIAIPNTGYIFVNWTRNGEVVSTETTYRFTATGTVALTANFKKEVYVVSVTEPVNGKVEGAGNYEFGTEVKLIATPTVGFFFTNWTRNGEIVSTESTYIFTATENVELTANFSKDVYAVTVTEPVNGKVEGAGNYEFGAEVELTAIPNTGYSFVNWTRNGEVVSIEPTYRFTVESNTQLTANFKKEVYAVTVTEPVNGKVEGAGNYEFGAEVKLIATPDNGFFFTNWTRNGEVVSTESTYIFTATENVELTANFSKDVYAVTVTEPVNGKVEGAGNYEFGSEVKLIATPDNGFFLTNWTRNGEVVSTESTYIFTATENVELTANFSKDVYTVTVTEPVNGKVEGGGNYEFGAEVELTAIPNTGYSFVNWTRNGEIVSTESTYSFTATENVELTANFSKDVYTVTVTEPVNGKVEGAGNYEFGTEVKLIATPAVGFFFTNWTRDGEVVSTESTYIFTATENLELTANFSKDVYTVTVTEPVNGKVEGGGNYEFGAEVELTAIPNTGYSFVNWTRNGEVVSTEPTYRFTATGTVALTANFKKEVYVVSVTEPVNGKVEGVGNYEFGAEVKLIATPDNGFFFTNWTRNREIVSTESTYSFTATENVELTANFKKDVYAVTVTEPVNGKVEGAGNYEFGAEVELTAIPNTGYSFVNWTRNGEVVSTELTYRFTVESNIQMTANFKKDVYVVSVVEPVNGKVEGAGNYEFGAEVKLIATPATGYAFVNWTRNGEVVSTEPTYRFTVESNTQLTANFKKEVYVVSVVEPVNGKVEGAGNYEFGTEVKLIATPDNGFFFTNWTRNGEIVSTESTYSFTATENVELTANFSKDVYTVTVTEPVNGKVEGGGNYEFGAEVELTAIPNTGYSFVNWTRNGEVVSTEPTYRFTATGTVALTANFKKEVYVVSVVEPVNGKVEGAGNYEFGVEVELTAIPNTGYSFVNWTRNGEVVSTETTYRFTATGNVELTANFKKEVYVVSVTEPVNGKVEGAGNYEFGSEVKLVATPAVGCFFTNWTRNGEVVSTESTYSFTATENVELTANFSKDVYVVSVVEPVNGKVEGAGNYEFGTEVKLIATPAVGFFFTNWTRNGEVVSTEPTYRFTVESNIQLTANFKKEVYVVSVVEPVNGKVEGAGNYEFGAEVELTAIPNTGYSFVNWTRNGEVVSTESIYSFTATENVELTANFKKEVYVVSVVEPVNGKVEGAGNYEFGTEVELTAIPNTGYSFVNWTRNGEVVSTEPTYRFTVESNIQLTANFKKEVYAVTVTEPVNGKVEGAGNYEFGTEVKLIATPAVGFFFTNWTRNGEVVSTESTYSFTATENVELTATFSKDVYAVTVTESVNGKVEGAGNYEFGTEVELTAIPNTGYVFVNWTRNGEVVSTEPTYRFTATGTVALTANFKKEFYVVSVTEPVNGKVEGAGNYEFGAEVELTAIPNTGYSFVNWTRNGEVVSTETTYRFTATGTVALTANFKKEFYVVSVTEPVNGKVEGAGNYEFGAEVKLIATPDNGFFFTNWTRNGEVVSTESTYSFTATENVELTANFSKDVYAVTVTESVNGKVEGAGNYEFGTEVELTAIPNTGYVFVNWTRNGEVVSTEPTYRFTATGTVALTANFKKEVYAVTVTEPVNGKVDGAGNYEFGTEVKLIATPAVGFFFTNWTRNGEVVSTESTYSFTATENVELTANFSKDVYAVTVTESVNGKVEGAGNYEFGTEVELTAIPNTGYVFVNWTRNGEVVSTEPTYRFTATGTVALTANFKKEFYVVSVTEPVNGKVEGAGNYEFGAEVKLIATPDNGFFFTNWTRNGEVVSTESTYIFTATENVELTANFKKEVYVVSVTEPVNGKVEGAGNYEFGTEVKLIATPAVGFFFTNWTRNGEVVSTESTYSFTATENVELTANFKKDVYVVSVVEPVNGKVEGAGNYEFGTEVKLIATPAAGFFFTNWTRNGEVVSTESTYIFTATENVELMANFSKNVYAVTVTEPVNGKVEGAGNYEFGAEVELTAIPNTGYSFVNWTRNGEVVSTEPTYRFTVESNIQLTANFKKEVYVVSVVEPVNGKVEGAGNYEFGADVELTAIPNTGYSFVNWTRNDEVVSTETTYRFTVESNLQLTANFKKEVYVVSVIEPVNGKVEGAGNYEFGAEVELTAIPNTGYSFVNWTCNGEVVSTEPTYRFTATGNVELTANFKKEVYVVSVTEPVNGTVMGTGHYQHGDLVELEAVANEDFTFTGWYEADQLVSMDQKLQFIAECHRHFTATFERQTSMDQHLAEKWMVTIYQNTLFVKGESEIARVELITLSGERILTTDQSEFVLPILSNGIYIVRIVGIDQKLFSKKVVIR